MPLVFVIAHDAKLRAAVRAELHGRGCEALGMEGASDAREVRECTEAPSALVLEGVAEIVGERSLQDLARKIPTVVVLSRVHPPLDFRANAILFRPVRAGEVAATAIRLLAGAAA